MHSSAQLHKHFPLACRVQVSIAASTSTGANSTHFLTQSALRAFSATAEQVQGISTDYKSRRRWEEQGKTAGRNTPVATIL